MIQSLCGVVFKEAESKQLRIIAFLSLTGISQKAFKITTSLVTLLKSHFASFLILLHPARLQGFSSSNSPKKIFPVSLLQHFFLLFPYIFFSHPQLFYYVAQFGNRIATAWGACGFPGWNPHHRPANRTGVSGQDGARGWGGKKASE